MKYCPNCGTQLDDSAKFCPSCGAAQPGTEPVKQQPKEDEGLEPIKETSAPEQQGTPRERFDYLIKNDERFRDIYRVTKIQNLFNLVNILYLIPVLVCLFTPIGMFTGQNAYTNTVPAGTVFTPLDVFTYHNLAGNHTLCPDSNLNGIMPLIVFIFSWILLVLIIVMSVAGITKGYMLKTYEGQNGSQTLIQNCKKSTNWIFGVAVSIAAFMAMLTQWMACDNNYAKAYEKNGGKIYIYGEIAQIPNAVIPGVIVTILFVVLIVVGITVPRVLFAKKLDKYIIK